MNQQREDVRDRVTKSISGVVASRLFNELQLQRDIQAKQEGDRDDSNLQRIMNQRSLNQKSLRSLNQRSLNQRSIGRTIFGPQGTLVGLFTQSPQDSKDNPNSKQTSANQNKRHNTVTGVTLEVQPIVTYKSDGTITFINSVTLDLIGLSESTRSLVIGANVTSLIDPTFLENKRAYVLKAFGISDSSKASAVSSSSLVRMPTASLFSLEDVEMTEMKRKQADTVESLPVEKKEKPVLELHVFQEDTGTQHSVKVGLQITSKGSIYTCTFLPQQTPQSQSGSASDSLESQTKSIQPLIIQLNELISRGEGAANSSDSTEVTEGMLVLESKDQSETVPLRVNEAKLDSSSKVCILYIFMLSSYHPQMTHMF